MILITSISLFKIVMQHDDDEALLRAYIQAWSKFFDQTNYLPRPFFIMEQNNNSSRNGTSSTNKSQSQPDNYVKKLMLDSWSKSIFSEIKQRLQNSAMKIIYSERIGESFDSQLVIGVRESYGKLEIVINTLLDLLFSLIQK